MANPTNPHLVNNQVFGLLVHRLREYYVANKALILPTQRVDESDLGHVVREYMNNSHLTIRDGNLASVDDSPFGLTLIDLVGTILVERFGITDPLPPASDEFSFSTDSMVQVLDLSESLDGQQTQREDPLHLFGLPVSIQEVAGHKKRLPVDAHAIILESAAELFRVPVLSGDQVSWRKGTPIDLVEGAFFVPSQQIEGNSVLYKVGSVEHGQLCLESHGILSLSDASALALIDMVAAQWSLEHRLKHDSTPSGVITHSSESFSDDYVRHLTSQERQGYILNERGGSYRHARVRDANIGDIFTPLLRHGQPVPFFEVAATKKKYEWEVESTHNYHLIAGLKGFDFPALVAYLQQGNPVSYGTHYVGLEPEKWESEVASWILDPAIPEGAFVHVPGSTEVVLQKTTHSSRTPKGEVVSYTIFEKVDLVKMTMELSAADVLPTTTLARNLASTPGFTGISEDENGIVRVRVRDGFFGLEDRDRTPADMRRASLGALEDIDEKRGVMNTPGDLTMANDKNNDTKKTAGGVGAIPPVVATAGTGARVVPPPLPLIPSAQVADAQHVSVLLTPGATTMEVLIVHDDEVITGEMGQVDPHGRTVTVSQVASLPPLAVLPEIPMAPAPVPPVQVVHTVSAPPQATRPVSVPSPRARQAPAFDVVHRPGVVPPSRNVPVLPIAAADKLVYYYVQTSDRNLILVNDVTGLDLVLAGRCQIKEVTNINEIPVGAFYRKGSDDDLPWNPAPFYRNNGSGEKSLEGSEIPQAVADYRLEMEKRHKDALAIALDVAGHNGRVKRMAVLGGVGAAALALGIGGTALYFNSQFAASRDAVVSLEKAVVAAQTARADASDKIAASAATYTTQAQEARKLVADFDAFKPEWDTFVSTKYAPVEAKTRQVIAYLRIAQNSIDVAAGNLDIAKVVAQDSIPTSVRGDIVSYVKTQCVVDGTVAECSGSDASTMKYWVANTANCSEALGKLFVAAGGDQLIKSGFVAREKGTWCVADKSGYATDVNQKTHSYFILKR